MVGKTWKLAGKAWWLIIVHLSQETGSEQVAEQGYKTLRPTPNDPLPSRLLLLKVLQLKQWQQLGTKCFQYVSQWGNFTFKPQCSPAASFLCSKLPPCFNTQSLYPTLSFTCTKTRRIFSAASISSCFYTVLSKGSVACSALFNMPWHRCHSPRRPCYESGYRWYQHLFLITSFKFLYVILGSKRCSFSSHFLSSLVYFS